MLKAEGSTESKAVIVLLLSIAVLKAFCILKPEAKLTSLKIH